VKGRIVG